MVILDDIDRGLHPKAQRALIQQLTEIADSCAGVCLIVSTHSPYILDEVPAEAVRVVRAFDGATQLRALVDHPAWQEWKSSMTSGEFWTYVGEDWMEQAP
jgi:predicted ATP-binding protein involved in virulence